MNNKKEEARENYLRAIYSLDNGEGVRSIDIAKKLKISKASVSEMLRKLAKNNLIRIKPYPKIYLTSKGKEIAEELFEKHYTIKSFVSKIFNLEEQKAIEEAHKLEHALSEDSLIAIKGFLENKEGKDDKSLLKPLPCYIG